MPQASMGNEGDRRTGKRGQFKVQFQEISEKVMRAKTADSNFPDSLRAVYKIVGSDGTVSLSVPINDPASRLLGFCEEPENAPTNEKELRAYISAFAIYDPIHVYVKNDFISSRLALEGEHTFVRITSIWPYQNKKPEDRLMFIGVTADGFTTSWNSKDPHLQYRIGDTPDQDWIGDEGAFHQGKTAFQYLQAFGLSWAKLKDDIENAAALWPGHYDGDGRPIEPLFPNTENPWPGFLEIIKRHGPNAVKMTIVNDNQYGLGPLRTEKFSTVIMKPVEIVGGADPLTEEFNREAVQFMEDWEKLTQALFSKPDARFMVAGKFTAEGRDVAVHVIKPVVHAYPAVVKQSKEDGTPVIRIPPTRDTWQVNGVVCLNFLAERLAKQEAEVLFNLVNLSEPNPEPLLAWVAENVPELAEPMEESNGEEL